MPIPMVALTRLLLLLILSCCVAGADTIRTALVSLCDHSKIATITAERGANPRVRKTCYWLELAWRDGRYPSNEMREVMLAVGWGGSAKGDLTSDAMVRNQVIAERLGCLDEAGMPDLGRGKATIIRTGPYAGDKFSVERAKTHPDLPVGPGECWVQLENSAKIILLPQRLTYQLFYDAERNDHQTSVPAARNSSTSTTHHSPSGPLSGKNRVAERVFIYAQKSPLLGSFFE